MNNHSSKTSFDTEVRSFRASFSPAAMRDISVWEHKVGTAMKKLPYLASFNPIKNVDTDEFFVLARVHLKDIGSNLDGVLKDYLSVIRSYVVGNKRCSYFVAQTSEGFDYMLSIIDEDNCYVTINIKTSFPQ